MIFSTEWKYPSRRTCGGAGHPTNRHIIPCVRARQHGEPRDARSSARPRGTKATLCRNDRLLSGSHLVAWRLGLALHGTLLLIHPWSFNPRAAPSPERQHVLRPATHVAGHFSCPIPTASRTRVGKRKSGEEVLA
jgi:hypothetical protein